MVMLRQVPKLCHQSRRGFASSGVLSYAGTWKGVRLQNPNIDKELPTYEFVKDGRNKKSKYMYVCGSGVTGSLGLKRFYKPEQKAKSEKRPSIFSFKRVGTFTARDDIKDIACGYGFTVVAASLDDSSHTALGFGLNSHSQIGYHTARPGFPLEIVSTPMPIAIPTKSPIIKVSCGRAHSLFLGRDGQVYSLGNNSLGQCGRPIVENEVYFGSKTMHRIGELPSRVTEVFCGQDHSMFLSGDGQLYSCGWGADGQTGLGHYKNQATPEQVKGDIGKTKITKVSTYADTVLALDTEGNVFGWGNTEYSQFRVLANVESEQFNIPKHLRISRYVPGKIVDIAAGGSVCAVLNDKGQVYVWGFGILGKGPDVDQSSVPTLIPESLFGMNEYNLDVKVEQIYAGLCQFAAITNRGDLYTWGRNRGAMLGLSRDEDQYFPMRVNVNNTNVKKLAFGVDHTVLIVQSIS